MATEPTRVTETAAQLRAGLKSSPSAGSKLQRPHSSASLTPPAKDQILDWLRILSDTYKEQFTDLQLLAYRLVLQTLKPKEIDLAFTQVLRTATYLPRPAEILAALDVAREKLQRPTPVDCSLCGGDGWVTIERPPSPANPSGYREAVRCTHWKPPAPPPEISTTPQNNVK